MQKLRLLLCLTSVVGVTLAGCGTKGPLYIPEQRYPQESEQQAPEQPASTIPPVETLPSVKNY